MAYGNGDPNGVSIVNGKAGRDLRIGITSTRLVFCVAACEVGRRPAAHPGRNWGTGSGAGWAAVPFWSSAPSCSCGGTHLGGGSNYRRAPLRGRSVSTGPGKICVPCTLKRKKD